MADKNHKKGAQKYSLTSTKTVEGGTPRNPAIEFQKAVSFVRNMVQRCSKAVPCFFLAPRFTSVKKILMASRSVFNSCYVDGNVDARVVGKREYKCSESRTFQTKIFPILLERRFCFNGR